MGINTPSRGTVYLILPPGTLLKVKEGAVGCGFY